MTNEKQDHTVKAQQLMENLKSIPNIYLKSLWVCNQYAVAQPFINWKNMNTDVIDWSLTNDTMLM